jgi:hypothetical protein
MIDNFTKAIQESQEAAWVEMFLEAKAKRQMAEVSLESTRQCCAEMLRKVETERLQAEETLGEYRRNRERDRERDKEMARPSREHWVEVEFDSEKDKWAARHQGVVAYGDTPEMACDNFDHIWVFGDNEIHEPGP